MEKLFPSISKLAQILRESGLPKPILPQIVFVGSESSVKSKVIEFFVQCRFLPDVTRWPLILCLERDSSNTSTALRPFPWGEFGHLGGQKFVDFDEIRKEIDRCSIERIREKKSAKDEPILLAIHSVEMINLTLIDIPAFTEDGESEFLLDAFEMVLRYIPQKNLIFLAICSAAIDPQCYEAVRVAAQIDKEGTRILGVIPDADIATKSIVPMEPAALGYACMSQVNPQTHDEFIIPNVFEKLEKLMLKSLETCFPDINAMIMSRVSSSENKLREYELALNEDTQTILLLNVLEKVKKAYLAEVDGIVDTYALMGKSSNAVNNSRTDSNDSSIGQRGSDRGGGGKMLKGGARLIKELREIFSMRLLNASFRLDLTDEELDERILVYQGIEEHTFTPDKAFRRLCESEIERFRAPCTAFLAAMHECCVSAVQSALATALPPTDGGLSCFPKLREHVTVEMYSLLEQKNKEALCAITSLVNVQKAFVNIKHKDLNCDKIKEDFQKEEQKNHTYTKETFTVRLVRRLVDTYTAIVRELIADAAAKEVMGLLVDAFCAEMPRELTKRLFRSDIFDDLFFLSHDEAEVHAFYSAQVAQFRQAFCDFNNLSYKVALDDRNVFPPKISSSSSSSSSSSANSSSSSSSGTDSDSSSSSSSSPTDSSSSSSSSLTDSSSSFSSATDSSSSSSSSPTDSSSSFSSATDSSSSFSSATDSSSSSSSSATDTNPSSSSSATDSSSSSYSSATDSSSSFLSLSFSAADSSSSSSADSPSSFSQPSPSFHPKTPPPQQQNPQQELQLQPQPQLQIQMQLQPPPSLTALSSSQSHSTILPTSVSSLTSNSHSQTLSSSLSTPPITSNPSNLSPPSTYPPLQQQQQQQQQPLLPVQQEQMQTTQTQPHQQQQQKQTQTLQPLTQSSSPLQHDDSALPRAVTTRSNNNGNISNNNNNNGNNIHNAITTTIGPSSSASSPLLFSVLNSSSITSGLNTNPAPSVWQHSSSSPFSSSSFPSLSSSMGASVGSADADSESERLRKEGRKKDLRRKK